MLGFWRRGIKQGRNTRSQTRMNATVIVMAHPAIENILQMPVAQRIRKSRRSLRIVPIRRSQTEFAWGDGGVFATPALPLRYGSIQFLRENAVPVVDEEAERMITR